MTQRGFPRGPTYGYDSSSQEANSAATLSLVFGILGVVLLPIVFGPLALWQAKKAERLGKPATAGKVLGWISIALVIIGIIGGIIFVIAMAMSANATASEARTASPASRPSTLVDRAALA
ncbi:DUF4190 domain-containing protein [Georgenia sp. SUBG003]|uniref:DUF4190 domain-containing protein n=1 Tax=Georgenia sp. SUBG003 TaxID=1497974 RepID=UPI003AB2BCB4